MDGVDPVLFRIDMFWRKTLFTSITVSVTFVFQQQLTYFIKVIKKLIG